MGAEDQRFFEKLVRDFRQWEAIIPYQFLMGIFVTFVLGRLMQQYFFMVYIDEIASLITVAFPDTTDDSLVIRRQLIRYIVVTNLFITRCYSPKVMKRIPYPHEEIEGLGLFKEIGVYTDSEDEMNTEQTGKLLQGWCAYLVMNQCWHKRCTEQVARELLVSINKLLDTFSNNIFGLDTFTAPLIYVQVITLVTYFLGVVLLISGQNLIDGKHGEYDIVIPIFALIRLTFAIGGLKIGEDFLCGYVDNENGFEINCFFDRMLAVGMYTVDKLANEIPLQVKDANFDNKYFIPYHTYASLKCMLCHDYYCPQSRLGSRKPKSRDTVVVKETYDIDHLLSTSLDNLLGIDHISICQAN